MWENAKTLITPQPQWLHRVSLSCVSYTVTIASHMVTMSYNYRSIQKSTHHTNWLKNLLVI